MKIITSFIKKEHSRFQKLDYWAGKLVYSISLTNIVSPLLSIFVSAFIFRQTNDINLVALYNLGSFFGIPIAFFVNGFLIKRIKVSKVYLFALVSQGLVLIPLIFFAWEGSLAIFFLGFLFGLSAGFYWSNRNFLTLDVTKSENRNYFSGLEVAIGKATGIVVPFIIGWFIISGEILNLYSPQRAYQLLLLVAIIILFRAGFIMKDVVWEKSDKDKFPYLNFGPLWNKARALSFVKGIGEGGFLFIPTLMVLLLVGEEGALGTLKSISAIISAIAIYYIGRKARIKDRTLVLAIGLTFQLIAALFFGILYSTIGVIIYFIIAALAGPLTWISLGPITLDAIDKDNEFQKTGRYNYLFDMEIYLNLGRVIGAGAFFLLASIVSTSATLRLTPVILAIIQMFVLPFAYSLSKQTREVK